MFRKLFILVLLTLPFAGLCQQKKNKKKALPAKQVTHALQKPVDTIDYKTAGAPISALRIITPDHTTITDKDLKNGTKLLLMIFNPMCEHCEDMTRLMEEHIQLFKDAKVVLMADAMMMPYLDYFQNNTKLKDFPAITIGIDSARSIERLFNYVALPQINIYSADQKLIKVFNGDTPIDSLKRYIQ